MSANVQQYYFVSSRDVIITSTQGYSLKFEKNVPMHVPKKMHPEVLEKGILACDKAGKALSLEDQPVDPEATIVLAPDDAEERAAKIEEAMMAIVKRNNPHDFSGGGVPSAGAVSVALGWKVDAKEIRPIWTRVKPSLVKVS